jgi:CRISPR-associated protein Cas2
MPRGEMLTVFSYDVSDRKRRNRIARLLEDAATRVQYSVFEARMSRRSAEILGERLAAELQSGDSLRLYCIGRHGETRCRIYGDGTPIESAEGYWLL